MERLVLGWKKLDEYFLSEWSRVCEMHVYRRLKRESDETRQTLC